ncbi:MAG: CocE/NonD family hydrolase, partial [Prochlorococcaceae cyanobacterium]
MRCSDGVGLVSRVWQPPGQGPWPVLLMRQPYGRAIASTVTYAHPSWYAARGFLVVVQDVRGCGDSQGRFSGFRQEARDGAEAVRWARTLPGSNGRLGTYGFSYQGLTQLLNDDALPDCLAPAMAGLDERLHWASDGGAHWWALGLAGALQRAALRCRRAGDGAGWRQLRESLDSGRVLAEGLAVLERHAPDGMGLGWRRRVPA